MARKRMISISISYSMQVHSLSEFAQLLFTWTVPHLDDFGRINGEPEVLKAIVMPMSKRSIVEFENAIQEMIKARLIERYLAEDKLVIQFINFESYQDLHKRTKSKFPENPERSRNFPEIPGNSLLREPNGTEENLNAKGNPSENFGKKEESSVNFSIINPKNFFPNNDTEFAALEAWKELEPNNPASFTSTYYYAYKRGLPAYLFHQFVSEIKQDKTILNKGAIFTTKVNEYLKSKGEVTK